MNDQQSLFLALGLFYLWDSLIWARPHTIVLIKPWLRNWKQSRAPSTFRNDKGGIHFKPLLPPFGYTLLNSEIPAETGPHGLLLASHVTTARGRIDGWLPWNEIKSITSEKNKIRINSKIAWSANSPSSARRQASHLDELSKATFEQRKTIIEQRLHQSFDMKSIREKWNRNNSEIGRLRALGTILFIYVFLVWTPIAITQSMMHLWLAFFLGMFGLTLTIGFYFHRAHKALYPGLADERFLHTMIVPAFAPAAMRAHDLLTHDLLETFHPLAIKLAFQPKKAAIETFTQSLRNVSYPLQDQGLPSEAKQQALWLTSLWGKCLKDMAQELEVQPKDLLVPPTMDSPACVTYCPRCHSQFTNSATSCSDCQGVALLPW
jgi:hypothetical protein